MKPLLAVSGQTASPTAPSLNYTGNHPFPHANIHAPTRMRVLSATERVPAVAHLRSMRATDKAACRGVLRRRVQHMPLELNSDRNRVGVRECCCNHGKDLSRQLQLDSRAEGLLFIRHTRVLQHARSGRLRLSGRTAALRRGSNRQPPPSTAHHGAP